MKVWVKSNEQETEAKQQYIKFDTFICAVALVFHFITYKNKNINKKRKRKKEKL